MKTIAFINAKGGVGKTTSAMVVADILVREYSKRVLLVDLDPQLNTSMKMGAYQAGGLCVAHLLVDKDIDIHNVIKSTEYGIDVIPCDKGLDLANQQALNDTANLLQLRLKKHFRKVQHEYDYCIIDCPTAIKNVSTINALAFTDDVLIPMTVDDYSIEGINDMAKVLSDVSDYNDSISLKGVFITQFENNNLCKELKAKLKEKLGSVAFDTHIRKTVKVKESTFHIGSLLDYAKNSTAVLDYHSLVKEYLSKENS